MDRWDFLIQKIGSFIVSVVARLKYPSIVGLLLDTIIKCLKLGQDWLRGWQRWQGGPWTPERRQKLSETVRRNLGLLSPEESEERLRNSFRSRTARETALKTFRSPRYQVKQGRMLKLYWESLSSGEKAYLIRNNPWFRSKESLQIPNETEKQLWKFLDQAYPGIFTPDWIERVDIGGKHPDFWTKNGYGLVVESNGNYWHSPEYFDRLTEEEQVAHYEKEGYSCIVVWADSPEDIIFEWPNLAKRLKASLGGGNGI